MLFDANVCIQSSGGSVNVCIQNSGLMSLFMGTYNLVCLQNLWTLYPGSCRQPTGTCMQADLIHDATSRLMFDAKMP